MNKKNLSVRIDEDTLNRFRLVTHYQKRSLSSQIVVLIKKCIEEHEKKHGAINMDEW